MSDPITDRHNAARNMVSALCKPRGTEGSREWMMSIPARSDYDPDIVISDSLRDIPKLQAKLAIALRALQHIAGDTKRAMIIASEALAQIKPASNTPA